MAWAVGDFGPFLDAVRTAYGRRPILAGHSQGAMFASALALQDPTLVAKAVGAASWVPEPLWSSAGSPIDLVHGTLDETVPYQRTAEWVGTEHARGAPIALLAVDGGHRLTGPLHAAWVSTVEDALEADGRQ